jgi:hypothetical protein
LTEITAKSSAQAEAELDRLIERRGGAEDPETKEALWVRSVERYNALLASRRRAEWCEYHKGQAARLRSVLEDAVARHEEAAAALEDA